MNYSILGDSDCPLVQIHLQDGESVKIENGSMAYLSDVVLEGKMNSSKKGLGGVLGAIGPVCFIPGVQTRNGTYSLV